MKASFAPAAIRSRCPPKRDLRRAVAVMGPGAALRQTGAESRSSSDGRERRNGSPLPPSPWRLAGASLAAAAAIGIGAIAYGALVERARVQLDEYSLRIPKPGLPARGLTILHVSDLHLRGDGRVQAHKLAGLRELIQDLPYDLALITGDLIHDEAGLPQVLALLGELQPVLGAFSVPGNHDYCEYTVLGNEAVGPGSGPLVRIGRATRSLWRLSGKIFRNDLLRQPLNFHDVPAMNEALRAHGVHPLLNEAVHVESGGVDLWIAGVDDLLEGAPSLPATLAAVPPGALTILLAHNPDAWLDPLARRADLVLSGHTHGGQVRLPLLGAVHTQGTHLGRRRASGWFQRGDSRLFVTRGVGESMPLRLFARPQIALIHLTS